jgi:hypothetical protein
MKTITGTGVDHGRKPGWPPFIKPLITGQVKITMNTPNKETALNRHEGLCKGE